MAGAGDMSAPMIRTIFTALLAYAAAFLLALAVLFAVALGKLAVRAQGVGAPGLPLVPLGACQLTPLASATKLSSCSGGIPARANLAALRAEGATVRWRDDGTAPTSAIGQPILVGDRPLIYSGTLSSLQFIAASGSPTLDVSFYPTGN
jgi:hypothetical protein